MLMWIPGSIQIICSSDIIIAEYLSIVTGCDHYRNNWLDLVFALQFTIRQNPGDVVFKSQFPSLLTTDKKNISLFFNKCL